MACCGLDKDKPLYVVVPIVTSVLVGAVVGCVVALVLSPFSRSARRATRVIYHFGASAVREVRQRVLKRSYLFSPRFRCVVSARLMRLSPRLGGLVYRRMGTILLAVFLLTGVGCWLAIGL